VEHRTDSYSVTTFTQLVSESLTCVADVMISEIKQSTTVRTPLRN